MAADFAAIFFAENTSNLKNVFTFASVWCSFASSGKWNNRESGESPEQYPLL